MATTTSQSTTYDLLNEDLVHPADGIEELTQDRPSPTTYWRWINKGLRGHRLRSVKVLGRTYTSRQEIRRWLAAVEAARTAPQTESTDEPSERPAFIQSQLESAGLA